MRKIFLALLVTLISLKVKATEGGGSNYLPGFYGDFEMAVIPEEQGTYFNNFMSVSRDSQKSSEAFIEIPGFLHVTDYKLLEGNVIFGVFPGLAAIRGQTEEIKNTRFGLLDAYIMPLSLNWNLDDISLFVYEGIIAPIGYYQIGYLSTGRNMWTFDHVVAFTWRIVTDTELSITSGYMNNLKNKSTNYKSGDEIHFDCLFGHYLSKELAVGLTGTYYRQVTADEAQTNILSTVYSEASSIGPALMYTPNIFNRDINLSFKWLHEFNVQGRLPQDYIIWRIFMSF